MEGMEGRDRLLRYCLVLSLLNFIRVVRRQQCQSNSRFSGWCSSSPCCKSDVNNYFAVECAERGGWELNLHASLQWPLRVLA